MRSQIKAAMQWLISVKGFAHVLSLTLIDFLVYMQMQIYDLCSDSISCQLRS